MSTIQYCVLLETQSRADMDGELSFNSAEDAFNAIYANYKHGIASISMFSVDIKTGAIAQVMDRREIKQRCYRYEEAERSEEAGEARHGSYADQHRQTISDVMGRA